MPSVVAPAQRANLTVEKNDGTTHHLDLRQINGETFAKTSEPASFLTGKAKANIWSALADKRGESLRQLSGGTLGWEGVVKLLGFVPPASVHAKTGRDEGANTLVTGVVDLALVPIDDHRYDELRVIGAGRLPFEATLDGSGRPVTITVNVPGAGTFTVQAAKIGEPFEVTAPAVG